MGVDCGFWRRSGEFRVVFVSGTDSAEWLRQAQAIRDTIAQLQAYKAEAVQMSFDSQLNATDAAAQKLDKQINA